MNGRNALIAVFRRFLMIGGGFSLALNLILLVPALFMLQVFDRVLVSRSLETLVLLLVLAASWLAVGLVLDVLRQRVLAHAAAHLDQRYGAETLKALLGEAATPLRRFDSQQLRDLATVRTLLTGPAILSLFDAPWFVVYLLVITLFHPLLGAIAAAASMLLVGLAWLGHRGTAGSTTRAQEAGAKAGNFVQASLRAGEAIAAHGMADGIARAWFADHDRALREGRAAARLQAKLAATSRTLLQALQVALLAVGAWLVIEMHVSTGVILAATILLGRLLAPLESISANWKAITDAFRAWQRLSRERTAEPGTLAPFEHPIPQGRLECEQVFFSPAAGRPPTLRNISFVIEPGESVVILGANGSGKSTLARLLVGIWQPTNGEVRLDGIKLQHRDRAALGAHLGYVPQDVQLISGSIAQNIGRFGEPDSEAVVTAARRALCHDLIARLPDDYRTTVGESGVLLSGGQRQRIALARALYGNPRLVVLDEPNANLDADGERDLDAIIKELRDRGVTTVVITQRMQVAEQVDRVIILRDGQIERLGRRRADEAERPMVLHRGSLS